jgi:dTDP-4-amino-4,6-dideoxygalactose transaminase
LRLKISGVNKNIPFNKIYLTAKEAEYMHQSVTSGKIGGNGPFTRKCENFFERRYGFKKALLTTSCTVALELCTMLLDLKKDDEVIIPSYTYVSSANPFVIAGAKIIFADSEDNSPNIDISKLETLIGPRTKAIVAVHYAGIACNMEALSALCKKYNLYLIEDAAHSIDAMYSNQPLGSFGDLAVFSFHETKNITSGEGGLLVIRNEKFTGRAEIIREKGTNRESFLRGDTDKYEWTDTGLSSMPADYNAAFLLAQLEALDQIQEKRKVLWQHYYELLTPFADKGFFHLPAVPSFAKHNAHIFFICCKSEKDRIALSKHLSSENINATFHYQALHLSPFYVSKHDGRKLPNAEKFTNCLLRLPLYYELTKEDITMICTSVKNHFMSATPDNRKTDA